MLVLSRRIGEAIYMGEDILVRVLERQGCSIRLGIEAPRDVLILREEIFLQEQSLTNSVHVKHGYKELVEVKNALHQPVK